MRHLSYPLIPQFYSWLLHDVSAHWLQKTIYIYIYIYIYIASATNEQILSFDLVTSLPGFHQISCSWRGLRP
jgi:hypothetical protein